MAFQGDTSGETPYSIDVQSLCCNQLTHGCHLFCCEMPCQDGENVAVAPLCAHPFGVFFGLDGIKAHIHSAFCRFEEHLFHHTARCLFVGVDQNAQRERRMNVGLADVEDVYLIFCHDGHEVCSQSRTIFTRDAYQYQFLLHKLVLSRSKGI